ncbi:hypothetical protein C9J21_18260 [Photobacterium phosphoreum]|uniref:hypothetical protein n=1 Tax=Photobacterium phosphoreum TaxID=659 RepID=UPI000D177642|nr:hypothetical protein [Photobacterium phosphoreum]PSW30831.1 hypothetical protein C9J21_18260 [Photobacterium phosphoreum]
MQLINPFYFSIDIYKNNLSVQLNSLIEQRSDLTGSDRAKIKEKAQILIANQIDNTNYFLRNYYGLCGITFGILLVLFFAKLTNSRVNNKVSNGINCMYVGERRFNLRKSHKKQSTLKKD